MYSFGYKFTQLFIFIKFLIDFRSCPKCTTTFGGIKRLGERAGSYPRRTKVNAWQNARLTTSPPMFYDRVL